MKSRLTLFISIFFALQTSAFASHTAHEDFFQDIQKMCDNRDLGSQDEINRVIEKLEGICESVNLTDVTIKPGIETQNEIRDCVVAYYYLARLTRLGKYSFSDEDVFMCTQQAALYFNYVDAICTLGVVHSEGIGVEKNEKKAVEYFQQAADRGLAHALYNLGACYSQGTGVEKNKEKSVEYFQQAGAMGHAHALYELAFCHMEGIGIEKNEKKAIEYYQQAAEMGSASASYRLGLCYNYGEGVKRDEKLSFKFFQKAANLGHVDAIREVGVSYKKGRGVEKDEKKGFEFLHQAADLADRWTIYLLQQYYNKRGYTKKGSAFGIIDTKLGGESLDLYSLNPQEAFTAFCCDLFNWSKVSYTPAGGDRLSSQGHINQTTDTKFRRLEVLNQSADVAMPTVFPLHEDMHVLLASYIDKRHVEIRNNQIRTDDALSCDEEDHAYEKIYTQLVRVDFLQWQYLLESNLVFVPVSPAVAEQFDCANYTKHGQQTFEVPLKFAGLMLFTIGRNTYMSLGYGQVQASKDLYDVIYGEAFNDVKQLDAGLKSELMPKFHGLQQTFEKVLTSLAPIKRHNLLIDSVDLNRYALDELLG